MRRDRGVDITQLYLERIVQSIDKVYEQSRTQRCTRRSLHIDFNEIGWSSWIIQPMTFDAHYCAGRCNYYEMRVCMQAEVELHMFYSNSTFCTLY